MTFRSHPLAEGRETLRIAYGPSAIERAAAVLERGGTVAFPTETVYGLGARADRADAVRAVFEAKGRPPGNPLIVHVVDERAAAALAVEWPEQAARLARAFWPGPMTLVVRRRDGAVDDLVTAGGSTVAVRVPAHPVARELLEAAALPIAAPSANRSSAISPTTADHVLKSLAGRIDCVLDAGATPQGIESTIVDVTEAPARLLRHGAIALDALEAVVAIVDRAAVVVAGERAPSPGSYLRHYAPRARLVVVPHEAFAAEVTERRARGERVGVLVRGEGVRAEGAAATDAVLVLPDDPAGFQSRFYASLHALDDEGCDVIVVAEVPEAIGWAAIRDRLRRASQA